MTRRSRGGLVPAPCSPGGHPTPARTYPGSPGHRNSRMFIPPPCSATITARAQPSAGSLSNPDSVTPSASMLTGHTPGDVCLSRPCGTAGVREGESARTAPPAECSTTNSSAIIPSRAEPEQRPPLLILQAAPDPGQPGQPGFPPSEEHGPHAADAARAAIATRAARWRESSRPLARPRS